MSIRKAAVAGQFYEADTALLQQQVGDLMSAAPSDIGSVPKALIVPHAGYIYSGSTAARAYRCLQSQRNEIRHVVLFGPAHRVYLEGMAVPSADLFATPLGDVPLDREAIDRITAMPGVCVSDQAHQDEHRSTAAFFTNAANAIYPGAGGGGGLRPGYGGSGHG